jgi:hypothetical protein
MLTATIYIDHHRDDISRVGYADIVGKRKYLLEGQGGLQWRSLIAAWRRGPALTEPSVGQFPYMVSVLIPCGHGYGAYHPNS